MTTPPMEPMETWRSYIASQVEQILCTGERHAPTIARQIRDNMPLKYLADCVYPAAYQETIKELKKRHKLLRAPNGTGKKVYQAQVQLELDGIVAYVKDQMARREDLLSTVVSKVQAWLDEHPEHVLTVSDILTMAQA